MSDIGIHTIINLSTSADNGTKSADELRAAMAQIATEISSTRGTLNTQAMDLRGIAADLRQRADWCDAIARNLERLLR